MIRRRPEFEPSLADVEAAKLKKFSDADGFQIQRLPDTVRTDFSITSGINRILQKISYFYKPILLICFISCSKPVIQEPCTLRISFNTYPMTTDPRECADFISSTLVCMIYEGLTRCLPGKEIENALAERVEFSKDQKTLRFYLRKAFWTDGEPITAFDFERSWKEILFPAKPCAFLFYPIKNAEAAVKGEVSIDEVGIKAINDQLLQVELEHPTPYFYSLTAFPSFLPAPKNGSAFSGPFAIQKSTKNSEITLVKNPRFWNQANVQLDQIQISIVPDEMTALEMFERDELDFLGGPLSPLPPDAIEKLKEQLIFIPNAASTLCTFNTQSFPFQNRHLRKAFAYAIDRQEIVDKVTQTGQIPASSILPPVFTRLKIPLFNLEKAKLHFETALEQLKISAEDLENLTLYFKPSQIEKRVAEVLQRQWKNAFGITIQLAQLDFKSHAHRLQTRNYQIALASWIAQFDDPASILDRFKDASQLKNYPGWQDDSYNAYLQEAIESDDRESAFQKAEEILIRDMPLSPIYHWSSPAICSPKIEKIATTPSGGILFERFSLAKK